MALRNSAELKTGMAGPLERGHTRLQRCLDRGATVTFVCVPRHGHGTAKMSLESLFAHSPPGAPVIYVDIDSPEPVRRYLEGLAEVRGEFILLRLGELASRQSARCFVSDLLKTPHTVFVDNNMLFSPKWVERLVATAERKAASVVSPIILNQGGEIHFSAGTVHRGKDGVVRPHGQAKAPVGTSLSRAKPRRVEMDFAESHACLLRTEDALLPDVLREELHNAQTLCYAAYKLKHEHRRKVLMEPSSVVSIVPIGFGYDLPWMLGSYMDLPMLSLSYGHLEDLVGRGPGTSLDEALKWHKKHLYYVLGTMADGDRLESADLLTRAPEAVRGYDRALPEGTSHFVEARVIPFVAARYPERLPQLERWMSDRIPCLD